MNARGRREGDKGIDVNMMFAVKFSTSITQVMKQNTEEYKQMTRSTEQISSFIFWVVVNCL
jgi:flagellar biosynthesis/type III secretory pathway ATPase